jgi:predicted transcriptional regulator
MSTFSLRLPNSLREELQKFAEADDVSMNQFITVAVAEKLAVLRNEHIQKYRQKYRTMPVSREQYLDALDQAGNEDPIAADRLETLESKL